MAKRVDLIFLIIFFVILILGILTLASASAPFSQEKTGNGFYFLLHQIIFGIIPGFFIGFLFFRVNTDFLKKYSIIFLILNLFLMLLVFIPGIGIKIRGGTRWIGIGPLSFQPSELLKLTFLIYLSAWLSSKTGKIKMKEIFLGFLFILGIIGLFLIAQPDVSTLIIIVATSLVLFFLAKTPFWQTFLIILIFAILFLPLIKIAPYRLHRILVFLNPEIDPMGIGYQIKQAQISIGSGKIFGVGLGLSYQKFGNLPQSFSDSIFAVFAEETGFIGSFFLILFYLMFFWRGFRIGKESKDDFEKYLSFGISFWIFFQSFVNIGAMIGILPLSGTPLPFFSYGGSHLASEIIAASILIKISKK